MSWVHALAHQGVQVGALIGREIPEDRPHNLGTCVTDLTVEPV